MTETVMESAKKQDLVHFDVGGKIFRTLRRTIARYPDSLLAKLLEEFPHLALDHSPVFVDRSPAYFEWILEIYRNGDYQASCPAWSGVSLSRELDFYLLPSMQQLGLSPRSRLCEVKLPTAYFVEALVSKIVELELAPYLPIEVWFCYELDGRHIQKELHTITRMRSDIFGTKALESIYDDFFENVLDRPSLRSDGKWFIKGHKHTHKEFAIRRFYEKDHEFYHFCGLCKTQGLTITLDSFRSQPVVVEFHFEPIEKKTSSRR